MMLSTSSYSKMIIKDNFKRYWAIPAVGMLAYILIGILPLALNYKSFAEISQHAATMMQAASFSINSIITILAVVAASAVFDYLHDPVSSNAIHSLPLNRRKLFVSSAFSGWVMMMIPMLIFAVMTPLFRGATSPNGNMKYDMYSDSMVEVMGAKEVFTAPHLLQFLLISTVTATSVYAIACLSGVLAGRKVIQPLLAYFLFFLPVTMVFLIQDICEQYLFGYEAKEMNYDFLNPMLYALGRGGIFNVRTDAGIGGEDAVRLIYYLAISAVLMGISAWIYSKIKLERIGNATTFPVVGDILAALLTLMGTLGFSVLTADLMSDDKAGMTTRFIIIALISSVIFYAIMRMIADSTPSVFNSVNIKKYVICLAILLVIIAFTALDITGYGKKEPAASEVESVHVKSGFPNNTFEVDDDFSDADTIAVLSELQKALIEDRYVNENEDIMTDSIELTWKMKNGSELTRTYYMCRGKGFDKTEGALKKLYNTTAYREKLHIDKEDIIKKCKYMEVYGEDILNEDYTRIKKEDERALLDAVDKDLSVVPYEKLGQLAGDMDDGERLCIIDVNCKAEETEGYDVKSFLMSKDAENTKEFLKSKGYIK